MKVEGIAMQPSAEVQAGDNHASAGLYDVGRKGGIFVFPWMTKWAFWEGGVVFQAGT